MKTKLLLVALLFHTSVGYAQTAREAGRTTGKMLVYVVVAILVFALIRKMMRKK